MSPSSTATAMPSDVTANWAPQEPIESQPERGILPPAESAGVRTPKVKHSLHHWSMLIENFRTSSLDYYTRLIEALEARSIPGCQVKRVYFDEGSALDPKREYLRIERGDIKIDVCAAPFGTGFFCSWWAAPVGIPVWFKVFILGAFLLIVTVPVPGVSFVLKSAVTVLVVLAVGLTALVERVLKRPTYYRVDTMTMFSTAVHSAVTDTLDGLKKAKGLRALTDDEKKPVMRNFFAK